MQPFSFFASLILKRVAMFPKKTDFWAKAYQQNAPKLLALCRRYVSDAGKAEDLMHDAFITAISKQDSFQGKGTIEGWLTKITLNTVLMYLRQDKQFNKMLHQIPSEDSIAVVFESEGEVLSTRELIQSIDFEANTLLEIINLLPEHHRTVFNLYVLEHFSHQQIAETLGINIGTSKSHLARARKKIQLILVQKAIEMKQKLRKSIYLPLLGTDVSYLDPLFQKKLSNHTIQPKSLPPHLKDLIQKTPTPIHHGAIYGFKSVLWVSTFCIGMVAWKGFKTPVLITQNTYKTDLNSLPAISDLEKVSPFSKSKMINSFQNTNQIVDNQKVIRQKPFLKPIVPISKPIEIPLDSQRPVLIKKQIILHDTIYQMEDYD
jgi:RNA polymerase sigma factor (sigma-70 family)